MTNRLLRRSFVAAVGVHLGILTAGGVMAPHLNSFPEADPMRTIVVALEPHTLSEPKRDPPPPPEPIAAASAPPVPIPSPLPPAPPLQPARVAQAPRPQETPPDPAPASTVGAAEEPGGALNLGAPSERGDIEGLPSGKTPVGWVPGADYGKGAGSGTAEGVGRPEPAPAVERPTFLSARPEPPPPPRRVAVRMCAATRLRPNPHCPEIASAEFTEGSEPQETCSLHRPPPPPPPAKPMPPPETSPEPKREEPRFTPARLVHMVKPQYPRSAVETDEEGVATLRVVVQADGSAGDVNVIRSSGNRILDAAAVKAVARWRWEPARRGDQATASTVQYRVRFELED